MSRRHLVVRSCRQGVEDSQTMCCWLLSHNKTTQPSTYTYKSNQQETIFLGMIQARNKRGARPRLKLPGIRHNRQMDEETKGVHRTQRIEYTRNTKGRDKKKKRSSSPTSAMPTWVHPILGLSPKRPKPKVSWRWVMKKKRATRIYNPYNPSEGKSLHVYVGQLQCRALAGRQGSCR